MRWLTGIEKGSYQEADIFHLPLIQTVPISFSVKKSKEILTHLKQSQGLILTSKQAVNFFFAFLDSNDIELDFAKYIVVAVGEATKGRLQAFGVKEVELPSAATQEGLLTLFQDKLVSYKKINWFWPRSTLSRPFLASELKKKSINLYFENFYNNYDINFLFHYNI